MEYAPLNTAADEIRVITILPTAEDGLVRCNLDVVSLQDYLPAYRTHVSKPLSESLSKRKLLSSWIHPGLDPDDLSGHETTEAPVASQYRFDWGDYACLSYTWGDQTITTSIIVNGAEVRVTTNLEAGLRAMRDKLMFCDGYKVWVDALCINQGDDSERGHQVGKMRSIYGEAWAVLIWLGVESSTSWKAMNLLRLLADYFGEGDTANEIKIQELKTKLTKNPEYLGRGSWVALRQFLDRAYWDRLWIIQEVTLSASKTVLCGTLSMSWDTLCRGLGTIHNGLFVMKNSLLEHDQEVCGMADLELWDTKNLHRIWKDLWALGRESRKLASNPLSIHRLLQIATQARAFDPRDKFYGLIGIIDPKFTRGISPSYDIDTGSVFNMATKAYIRTSGNLEVLREANPWSGTTSASWAVDWNWAGSDRFSPHPKQYNASGSVLGTFTFSEDGRQLFCRGFVIDQVDGLGPSHRADKSSGLDRYGFRSETMVQSKTLARNDEDIIATSLTLSRALTRDRDPYNSTEEVSNWQQAILNLPASKAAATAEFKLRGSEWDTLASDGDYYLRWSLWREAHAHFMVGDQELQTYFRDEIPSTASHVDHWAAYTAANSSQRGRRLTTTVNGRIGWVPDNYADTREEQIQRGDLFCILFGCSTPLLIRPGKECIRY